MVKLSNLQEYNRDEKNQKLLKIANKRQDDELICE